MKLGSNRGTAHALCCDHEASYPHEFRAEGQVGQESHRRPAVVEPAALRSGTFTEVHEHPENGPFCWLKVSGRSPTSTGVGVSIGVKATGDSPFDWMPVGGQDLK